MEQMEHTTQMEHTDGAQMEKLTALAAVNQSTPHLETTIYICITICRKPQPAVVVTECTPDSVLGEQLEWM